MKANVFSERGVTLIRVGQNFELAMYKNSAKDFMNILINSLVLEYSNRIFYEYKCNLLDRDLYICKRKEHSGNIRKVYLLPICDVFM